LAVVLPVHWRLVKADEQNPEKATVVVGDSVVYSHVRLSEPARQSIIKEMRRHRPAGEGKK
jgi:hypothetical protein